MPPGRVPSVSQLATSVGAAIAADSRGLKLPLQDVSRPAAGGSAAPLGAAGVQAPQALASPFAPLCGEALLEAPGRAAVQGESEPLVAPRRTLKQARSMILRLTLVVLRHFH